MSNRVIIKATIIVAAIAFFSKVIGFFREVLIASFYGANSQMDAYFLAHSMPSMIFPAVCNSFSTAFLSMYVKKNSIDGEKSSGKFAFNSLVFSLFLALILSILGWLSMPYIVVLFAPGFDESTKKLAIKLSRLIISSFIFTMSQYMFTAILNSKKIFYAAQISGIIYNCFIIIVTVLLGKNQSVEILTLTVVFGLILQNVILLFFIIKKGNLMRDNFVINKDIKGILDLAIPILLGNSIVQINNIVDKMIASNIAEGAISAISYSNSINSIVISIIITSLSTVLYPSLVEAFAKDEKQFNNIVHRNLRLLILVIIPISIITSIYAKDIVIVLYGRGNFSEDAVLLTTDALFFYSFGYIFMAVREIIIRAFYAMGDSKTPMVNGTIAVFLNIIFSIIFSKYLGVGGIALASSFANLLSSIILFYRLKSKTADFDNTGRKDIKTFLLKLIIVYLIVILVLIVLNRYCICKIDNPIFRFSTGTILGAFMYIVVINFFSIEEWVFLKKYLKSKLNK